jgi:hypothetical protein
MSMYHGEINKLDRFVEDLLEVHITAISLLSTS